MSSAEDADDERESPAPTPIEDWIDPKCLKFTVFIVLPNDEVCTIRDMPSGVGVDQLKSRIELQAGIPSQMYSLIYPDGEELAEDQRLVVRETILDGYLLKMRLYDNWEALYITVTRNCIEQVYHSGGVHLKGNITISVSESDRYENTVRERGAVALFIASFLGLQRMANMLLSVGYKFEKEQPTVKSLVRRHGSAGWPGSLLMAKSFNIGSSIERVKGVNVNSTTLFGRTPLHAAVAKDHVVMADFLLSKGASIRKSDCYGIIPLELARQMSSTLCFRKLRLMQLNFRGSSNAFANKKTNISIEINTNRSDTSHQDRTHSKVSHYSDRNSLPSGKGTSRHVSRKHVSSSAPVSVINRSDLQSRDGTQSSLSNATTSKLRQTKQNVRWKDTQTEYIYLKHLNSHTKGPNAVEGTVKIKPMTLAHPKTIVKYSNIARKESLQAKHLIGPEHTTEEHTPAQQSDEKRGLTHVMKYSKERLNHFKKLATPQEDYVPMKDRKKHSTDQAEVSVAFKNWLKRKTAEIEEAEETSTSMENFNESESEEDKMYEFNKRVRKKNRDDVMFARCITPGNRPVMDIMQFGSTQHGDGRNPPEDLNIGAYKEWRKTKRGYLINMPKAKSANDILLEKRRLEEKRQKLLMTAISYEEWMDHTEERKMLIKQILQADREEMTKLEEEKIKYRQRMFSYDTWKEKLHKRGEEDKKRKAFQKRYDAERMKEKMQFGERTTAVPFEEWLKKKRSTMSKEKAVEEVTNTNRNKSANSVRFKGVEQKEEVELEVAYNNWLAKNG